MTAYIDLKGASGAAYRYTLAEGARPASVVAGVYVYVRQSKKEPLSVLFMDQCGNLSADAPARWAEAASAHHATHLYTRLIVARATRDAEIADLLAVMDPVMNGAA